MNSFFGNVVTILRHLIWVLFEIVTEPDKRLIYIHTYDELKKNILRRSIRDHLIIVSVIHR